MKNILSLLGSLIPLIAGAQIRYLEPIFDQVIVETDVVYASNIRFYPLGQEQDLLMDVYLPAGDVEQERPVVIYLHGGFFLPPYYNNRVYGSRQDSSVVEICRRLAARGYVAVAATYRQGWSPFADMAAVQRATFIQAFYRGLQDVRSCIRFLRKSVDQDGNPYGIDSEKIVVWGEEAGGVIAFGAAFLDQYSELLTSEFIHPVTAEPVIDESLLGDPYGITPAQFSLANHEGYSSGFKLAFSMGGGLLSLDWIDGEPCSESVPQVMACHVPTHPFLPYSRFALVGPTQHEPFIGYIYGSRLAIGQANSLGINAGIDHVLSLGAALDQYVDSWKPVEFDWNGLLIPTTVGVDHLYPFVVPNHDAQDAPWGWWRLSELETAISELPTPLGISAEELHNWALQWNPDMSPEKGRAYIDTIMTYFTPRACAALCLEECLSALGLSPGPCCSPSEAAEVFSATEAGLTFAPNPASSEVLFRSKPEFPMLSITIFNISGKPILRYDNVNHHEFRTSLDRAKLPAGMYFVRARFDEGVVTGKLVVD
jgi:hypothetical protein